MEAVAGISEPGRAGSSGAPALVFVGFMGAGKSGAARTVARELGAEPLDSDRELERALGEPLEAFFDREGEAGFRAREEAAVLELLARRDARVISLGGGAIGSERVRDALRGHVVVHLAVSPGEAWRRASGKGRPLARDRGRFDQLHADRLPVYEAAADALLPAGNRDLARVALPALLALRDVKAAGAPAGLRLVWARSAGGGYPVFFGHGALARLPAYPPAARRFLVTDANVASLYEMAADARAIVPAGEAEKTLGRAEAVLREMAAAELERDDLVLALGGGVVGDLAGFCAAVYQRGIRHVQLPTTLVAQVDSAYGGKTGVDLPEAKNYVGAYHQPAAVIVDPGALDTLPSGELAAGYAEVVKTALIAGGPLWSSVRKGGPPDAATILACLRTKLAVVAEDERDQGRRQVLNLGHTVGHAIETATGYRRYSHGEAVAAGLLAALRLSGRDALRGEVAELFAARGLPLQVDARPDDVLAAVARDKKRRGGAVRFVLLEAPGRVTPGHEVDESALRAAVEEVCTGG